MRKLLACLGCVTLLSACANEVVIEPENSAGGTGGSGSSSSGTTGGSSNACVPQDPPPTMLQPTCQDLDRLTLASPSINGDTDGDGKLEPGESATISVSMQDISGMGFNWYPGVNFESSDPKASISADSWFYAILPCSDQIATATIAVSPDAASGTMVNVRAQVGMLNEECPNAFAIDIPVQIH